MTVIPSSRIEVKIPLPASDPDALKAYQNALLSLLSKIEINNCNSELKEHLKKVYELLKHLKLEEDFLSQRKALLKEAKGKRKKDKA